jgi:Domain of unknown function (DUF4261)
MNLISRFFGKSKGKAPIGRDLIANPKIDNPLSLQLLFLEPYSLIGDELLRAIRSFHISMSAAQCEFDSALNRDGTTLGMFGWGEHVIRCVGFNLPMPPTAVEACIAPSHYSQDIKEHARAHKAHLLLYYGGYENSPYEQYTALAAAAAVLSNCGAYVVLNESAVTSLPVAILAEFGKAGDAIEMLRNIPLPYLYCGFAKYEVEDKPGVWMRTHGASLLGLPDFAAYTEGHHEGERYFQMFDNILSYLRESGAKLEAGHTLQIESEEYLRFRRPRSEETFLESDTKLLVVELIRADQINRRQ